MRSMSMSFMRDSLQEMVWVSASLGNNTQG